VRGPSRGFARADGSGMTEPRVCHAGSIEEGAAGYFVAASLKQLAGALQPGSFQASLNTPTPAAPLPAADEPELSQVLDAILTARATEPARVRRDTNL
jgi:hypothetical protein